MNRLASVQDFEQHAKRFLAPAMFDYINGTENVQDSQEFFSIQLKLRGMANLKYFVDPISTNVLGQPVASPICISTSDNAGMVHKDGELGAALAATEQNQIYCLSSLGSVSIEQIAEAVKDKGKILLEIDVRLPEQVRYDLVVRASKFQCYKGIILNSQYISSRITEPEWKHDFQVPPHLQLGSLLKYKNEFGTQDSLRNAYGLLLSNNPKAGNPFQVSDISQVKKISNNLKVVVKGIMTKEDAFLCLSNGADGIWVSNGEGAKQEFQASTISVLQAIASEVKVSYPKAEIFVSSGIRRGTDVMKCLALGATAVFVKRPIMMALFFQGQDAVNHMINLLNEELKLAMALTSCFKVNEITTTQVIHKTRARL